MTKSELIRYLEKNDACSESIEWLNEQEMFGPELIEKCPDMDWLEWLAYRVNPAEYEAKMDHLWDEYDAKRKPLRDEYEAKTGPLRDEYDAKVGPLRDEYDAKMGHLWDEYEAKKKPLWDEYYAKVKPLRDEYEAKVRVELLDILTWEAIEQAVAASGVGE